MIAQLVSFLTSESAHDPTQTTSWIFPETAEIIYGGISSLVVFAGLYKFGWPPAKKAMAARTERIQKELDGASGAKTKANDEATKIRSALGDIGSEKVRLLSDADTQAAVVLAEGRQRLASELADLEAKAEVELSAVRGRGNDELRSEIAHVSSVVAERVVRESLDGKTQQKLIEDFIAKVGV